MRSLARLSLLLLVVGCGAPYADAVGSFAKTAADGTGELMKFRSSLVEACQERYEYEYLVKAAERLEVDLGLGQTWAQATEKATKACAAEGTTARGFELSVEAIASYTAALGALANAGKDLGDKAGKLGSKLDDVIPKLTGDAGDAAIVSGAAKAAKILVDDLVRERRREDLSAFVLEADPYFQTITANLEKYLAAAKLRFDSANASREEVLKLVELPVESPAPSVTTSAPAPKTCPSPDPQRKLDGALIREQVECVVESARQKEEAKLDETRKAAGSDSRSTRYLRELAFFDLAHRLAAENRTTSAAIDGYVNLVKKLSLAHSALRKAGNDPKTLAYKDAIQEIIDLGQQLGELKAAFDGVKGI